MRLGRHKFLEGGERIAIEPAPIPARFATLHDEGAEWIGRDVGIAAKGRMPHCAVEKGKVRKLRQAFDRLKRIDQIQFLYQHCLQPLLIRGITAG